MFYVGAACAVVGLLWIATKSESTPTYVSQSIAPSLQLKLDAADATGDLTSTLVNNLEGLPPDIKAHAIEAIVKANPDLLRLSADEIDNLGYHDLAEKLRHRADAVS